MNESISALEIEQVLQKYSFDGQGLSEKLLFFKTE